MYSLAKKNTALDFHVALRSQADTRLFQVNPTLAAGDFQISIDGGGLTNLTTLPVVQPAGGVLVRVSLSAAEMNGSSVTIVARDVAGSEWCDEVWNIRPQIDTVVLQTLSMGIKADARLKFEELQTLVSNQVETLRIAVLDLQQAILRGKG